MAGAGLAYGATESVVRLLRLAGASRGLTGSYEVGSYQPAALPATQWMFDSVPRVDPQRWSLEVSRPDGARRWTYPELLAFQDELDAVLDCTGGFYSAQRWSGVRLSRLIGRQAGSFSVHIQSLTRYDRRFSAGEAERLLLATRLGGEPLDAAHGFPVRLVAPDHRGYWWVKWVGSVRIEAVPAWWQLPFPAQ
jgi:DMSO/TMAO reductase YedYZ molybdopterin-dependent catalytic subunit